ncbi:unnamed protein product [Paramecium octaurelia]|uniref:Uncharacterized protein n=1 Tax=Paramecium octaurelia TaxID=43137 RepID=A0A8S1XDM5_PAROT|nr:unnamed protein product [Paramecium octaurelia]
MFHSILISRCLFPYINSLNLKVFSKCYINPIYQVNQIKHSFEQPFHNLIVTEMKQMITLKRQVNQYHYSSYQEKNHQLFDQISKHPTYTNQIELCRYQTILIRGEPTLI